MDEKVIVAWNCIKSLEHYPITCSTNEEQDEFKKIPFRPFITTGVRVKYFTCLGIWNLEKIKKLNVKFEENRFFPVQYANQFL